MIVPRVFIASSSEGLDVAKLVRGQLLEELDEKANIGLWKSKFELSAAYIESLEKAARESDFAVLVLTPDDITTSRETEKPAPRDNIVFELGLFIGVLGRERCFLVHEQRADLKIPTDLLGVKAATLERLPNRDLKADLAAHRISQRIIELGSRHGERSLGNAFWLGHDLARVIRFVMFEPRNRDEIEKGLRQAVHHMDEVGVLAPDVRRLLLHAIKAIRESDDLTEDNRKELINAIATAKNELGSKIAELQPSFKAYATIEGMNDLNQQLEKL